MDVFTPKAKRRSTRLRVEIPLLLTSMDRRHPFSAQCVALVVSPQGCGLRATQALPIETPVLLGDLPGGSTSGRVASCLPLGNDGKHFLIGVSLYNHGNIWGIADPPEDWDCGANRGAASPTLPPSSVSGSSSSSSGANVSKKKADAWPYNLSSSRGELHPTRK